MGVLNIIKKVFAKDKKVVICGLDSAGKTTMISFLQYGTYIEHTPTMGKDQTTIEVQGVRMNLVDMGGQKDFRGLWLGEIKNAQCLIFVIDAANPDRFEEAKKELWKLASLFKKVPLVVLANKHDLDPTVSIGNIITALDLTKLPSFEVLPISCKTGFGMVPAFTKIYYKLTGNELTTKLTPKALTIFDIGGVPLTTQQGDTCDEDILKGGLYAAITSFIKESFKSELNQLKIEGNIIIIKRSQHFMGSLILDDNERIDLKEAETSLEELLQHLEHMCPELEQGEVDPERVDYLVNEFSTNLFN